MHDRIGIGLLFRLEVAGVSEPHRFELRLEDAKGNEIPLGDPPPGPQSPGKITRLGGELVAGPAAGAPQPHVPTPPHLNRISLHRTPTSRLPTPLHAPPT